MTVHTATSLLFLSLASLAYAGETDDTPEQPNVLVILTDDEGYGDLSINDNPYIETPNIDRLSAQGVSFDRFYVGTVCAPSRASLLTGRYPVRTGTHSVTRNREAMKPSEVTLAEALKTAGYTSGYIGKWHNGAQYPYVPMGQGFDEFFGFTAGHINNYFDPVLVRGVNEEEKTSGFVTDVLTDEAIRFVTENKDRPFLCYLNYNAPHSPYQAPDSYYDPLAEQGLDPAAAAHWAMCKNIDDNVGRLLQTLDSLGLREDTIVIFLTDNGAAGVAAEVYNAHMRGWKTSTHEGGSRVPFFVSWPGAEWEPHSVGELAGAIDLYPTLLDLCGVPQPEGPPLDGKSLKPLLEDKDAAWQPRILFTHNGIDESNRYPGAVRTPRYRLVCRIDGAQAGSAAKNNDASVSAWELYDMIEDPGETHNLADEQPDLVLALSTLYENWVDDIFSEGLQRFPLPVGYDEHNPVRLHASQSYFSDPIHYQSGRGFAHDWLTGWTDTSGKIWFDIDVVEAGTYAVEIAFDCPTDNAGSSIVVRCGDTETQAVTVPPAPIVNIDLPHRDEFSRETFRMREWTILDMGELELPAGKSTLTIEADSIPNGQVLEFKHISLRKL